MIKQELVLEVALKGHNFLLIYFQRIGFFNNINKAYWSHYMDARSASLFIVFILPNNISCINKSIFLGQFFMQLLVENVATRKGWCALNYDKANCYSFWFLLVTTGCRILIVLNLGGLIWKFYGIEMELFRVSCCIPHCIKSPSILCSALRSPAAKRSLLLK